jgi:hypothetical protein
VAPILKSATGFEGLICEQKIQSDYILVQNARFAANDELLDQLPQKEEDTCGVSLTF